ncbi:MAG: methylenetetrahydrofolate--tRNA-(uracil(54)-C(5))-methyltransferase (FADH(2)-oxidizing) TrmFO [Chitinivibrionales bacterium]
MSERVAIIGAGLAGSEAALLLGRMGIPVSLYEMRPQTRTPAHKTDLPAELVCSNSLKSMELPSAHGLLKKELQTLGSPLLDMAIDNRIPAGSALAVDRTLFSEAVLQQIEACEYITMHRLELSAPPEGHEYCIIAAGPLVSDPLVRWLQDVASSQALSFYDAIAPIVSLDSINTGIAFYAARWEEESTDYLNCPFDEEEYRLFYDALVEADRVKAREFEDKRFFEACLPVEVVAGRGYDALRFGTLRPIGLTDPRTGKRPFAVCQLRRETASGESWGLVGFQTRLNIAEQRRVFCLIPGLQQAEFLRFGSIHRNTYIHSPLVVAEDLSIQAKDSCFVAGQLCGNEGYTESIATGHLAARFVAGRIGRRSISPPPSTTALGALLEYVTSSSQKPFVPSNINFGLLQPLEKTGRKKINKAQKKEMLCTRALEHIRQWADENGLCI